MMALVRFLGFLDLLCLPGAWVTFGVPGLDLPRWVRTAGAVVITPLVLCVQFYAVRLLGVSFERSAPLLIAVNLPAALLVVRALRGAMLPDRTLILGGAVALLVPLACLAPQLMDTQARVYSGHAWMHADIVYMIANGDLVLDDPELVGVRLDYYWAGHVYQALLSYVLGSPPVSNYIWTNLVMLVVVYAFLAGIVFELGGHRWAMLASILWLCFALNAVGYTAGQLVRGQPAGDPRYTPWLFYFFFFHQITIALAVFAAVVYLLVRRWPAGISPPGQLLVALLLCAIGVLYPILMPAAFAVVFARMIASAISGMGARDWWRESLGLGIAAVAAAALTGGELHMLTRDRVVSAMGLHSPRTALNFGITTVMATLPLLIGFAWTFARCWRVHRSALVVLVLGALASALLYVIVDIRPGEVEYKFMFTAALCLAPFPSLALEPLMQRLGRLALPVYALVTLALAAPFAHKMMRHWPWGSRDWGFVYTERPRIDTASFDLRLVDAEPAAGLYDAIRLHTPVDSLVVADSAKLHLPALTRRRLFVASDEPKAQPGVNVVPDHLLTVLRGYDPHVLDDRRRVLRSLYDAADTPTTTAALREMLAFHRPLVLILDAQRHQRLHDWLSQGGRNQALYEGNGASVWLVTRVAS